MKQEEMLALIEEELRPDFTRALNELLRIKYTLKKKDGTIIQFCPFIVEVHDGSPFPYGYIRVHYCLSEEYPNYRSLAEVFSTSVKGVNNFRAFVRGIQLANYLTDIFEG